MAKRRALPPSQWREWYFDLQSAIGTMRAGDVLASWARLAAPAYYPRGHAPTTAELAARPQDFEERDGTWWEVEPLRVRPPDGKWHVLLDGSMVVAPDGSTIVDREEARRALAAWTPVHPLVADAIERMASGRQNGKRSAHHAGSVARALAILGLVDSGMTHRAAVRQWIAWDAELHGANTGPDYDEPEYVDQVRMATRNIWRRHGLGR
jgi:hypothetical protein